MRIRLDRPAAALGFALTLLPLLSSGATGTVEWVGLEPGGHLGGRKASEGYLQGKVVLVCRWDASNGVDRAGREFLSRMEEVWSGFKTKQFVLLGSPSCDPTSAVARASVEEAKVSFPVYAGSGLRKVKPKTPGPPSLYAVDETGLVVYRGRDERMATQAIVTALTDADAPRSPKQWKRFLDYELDNLPAHAYLRLRDFRKKFPKEAREYAARAGELSELPNLKAYADLVAFAKRAKDAPAFGPKDGAKAAKYRSLVESVLKRCEAMKESDDPRLAREAKNALADLKWIQATF